MPVEILESEVPGSLAARLAQPASAGEVVLHWLGQAGFILTAGGLRLLIDPYLSDSLAEKYRNTPTPHERMMPVPIDIAALPPLDLVLVTHQHTDHMDPATLAPLAAAQPGLRFIVPTASRAEAERRIGVGPDRLHLVDAGQVIQPMAGLRVTALRAAHEALERDAEGHHRFLGYALRFDTPGQGGVTLVHSGDTVPFEGQAEELARLSPDLLLLPVNGRSELLRARGIAGNLDLEEAIGLTVQVGAAAVVAHHHGLFAFNSRPLAEIEARAAAADLPIRLIAARPALELRLRPF